MSRVLGRTPAFLFCSLVLLFVSAFASGGAHATLGTCDTAGPIEVEATGAGAGPTAYATLNAAFAAINGGTHTLAINIEVCGNSTEPAAGAVLNASGAGSASYTSITIKPVGGAARAISGAATAGVPLIDFNGADNVTIDGLNTDGNQLTISNTTVSATSNTSTIRFIADATSNTVTNATVLGAFTAAVGTNGGNIFFSTGTTTGNDNNTVSNCSIGPAGATLPTKGVYGNGSATNAAVGNNGIIINNNNIFDVFGPGVASAGVYVGGGNSGWSIMNNKIYQTGTRTWTAGVAHHGINIQNTTATTGAQSFVITGNTIGFSSAAGTGTYTLTGAFAATFIGLEFNGVTGGGVTDISTNTVANISMTGVTSNGSGTTAPFIAIYVHTGFANTISNVVGSQSTTGR
jgi:hypothetical protein